MCTHTLNTLNQPPACFLCRHLEGRPGLRMQTPHLHPPTSWLPPSTVMTNKNLLPVKVPHSGLFRPPQVTAIPGIRHKHSDKFSPCSPVRKKAVESSHPSRLAKVWPGGEADRQASPQGGMAVQTNKPATSVLCAVRGQSYSPGVFLRQTQALDQCHGLYCCVCPDKLI